MEVIAKVKNMPHAPRKVTPVIALVRGRTVADAMTILEHTPRAAAKDVAKMIHSAKANAINNYDLTEKSLSITTIDVGTGQRLKRFRPASRGRALPYQKRSSNVRVVIEGSKKAKKATPKKEEPAKKAAAKKPQTKKKEEK